MPTFQPSSLPAGAYRVSNKNHDYWIVDADGNIIGQTGANGQDTFFASYQTDSNGNVVGLLGPGGEEISVRTAELLDYNLWSPENAAKVISQLTRIFNPKNNTGMGIYKSGVGTASSSGTTVTVDSTVGLALGMRVTCIAGTGLFNNSTVLATTEVATIISPTQFTVTRAPITPLVGGTVYGCKVFKVHTGPYMAEIASPFEGAVYLPDGRVVFSCVYSTHIGLFDPRAMEYTRGPAHGETTIAWGAATLGYDGNVYFMPTGCGYIGKFDVQRNTYTRMAAVAMTGTSYGGMVLVPDGRLVGVPVQSANVCIYNPVANTVATVAHGLSGGTYFSSGTIAPNGKVYFAPYGAIINNVGIFDPVTNTFSLGAAVGVDAGVASKYEGGIVMPNGNICFVPNKGTVIGIYDPITDIWTDGPAHNLTAANGVFTGGTLMADGRVLMPPRSTSSDGGLYGIYDPYNNCFSTNAGLNKVASASSSVLIGGCMTAGGKFVSAGLATHPIVLNTEMETANSHQMCLHPLYNKQ